MAVGFWNFTAASVFGFLINMPIISCFAKYTASTHKRADPRRIPQPAQTQPGPRLDGMACCAQKVG
jgi:hypothetical protein